MSRRLALVKPALTLGNLAQTFWEVSECWNNYRLAKSRRMTTEKAISKLNMVIDLTKYYKNGERLRRAAWRLLREVVENQDPIPEVEAEA
jgi:hypothetical protein